MDKEICICAAIKAPSGYIWRGHRHCHCLDAIEEAGMLYNKEYIQGFMTSNNRFVDRYEGYILQIAAGIESVGGGYRNKRLFSEDLY